MFERQCLHLYEISLVVKKKNPENVNNVIFTILDNYAIVSRLCVSLFSPYSPFLINLFLYNGVSSTRQNV